MTQPHTPNRREPGAAAQPVVYLNGRFVPAAEACVSVLDRGFLFGDGVYEVIPVYGGRLFRLEEHLDRLNRSLAGVRIRTPLTHAEWGGVLDRLISANSGGDQSVYIQVTRGVAPRDHAFPPNTTPTVFAMSNPLAPIPEHLQKEGIAAIAVDDIRWRYCDIKAITLLPNVLLRQQALDEGAGEAILVRDGMAKEGSASNLFVVRSGDVITPPKGPLLLPGITRDLVLELCGAHGIPCREAEISLSELETADEAWITSSTREVLPVTRLNGRPLGDGRPGPLWRRVATLYTEYKQAFRRGAAPAGTSTPADSVAP